MLSNDWIQQTIIELSCFCYAAMHNGCALIGRCAALHDLKLFFPVIFFLLNNAYKVTRSFLKGCSVALFFLIVLKRVAIWCTIVFIKCCRQVAHL